LNEKRLVQICRKLLGRVDRLSGHLSGGLVLEELSLEDRG
jgi:hypothetical protein